MVTWDIGMHEQAVETALPSRSLRKAGRVVDEATDATLRVVVDVVVSAMTEVSTDTLLWSAI